MAKKINNNEIRTEEFTIHDGVKVTAFIGPEFKGLTQTGRRLNNKQSSSDDPLIIGGKDYRSICWDDLFNEHKINKLFADYKPIETDDFGPFAVCADDPAKPVGLYLQVTDEVTKKSHGDIILKDTVGTLLVMLYVLTKCVDLKDKRGHVYSIGMPTSIDPILENFYERVETEATPNMRMYFAFAGGLLESTVKSVGTSPKKVLKLITKIIK